MKAMIKTMLQSIASAAVGPMHREIIQNLSRCETEIRSLQTDMRALTMKVNHPFFTKEAQIALYLTYKDMVLRKVSPLPDFREVGFRCHSQFEEDGILLFLFAVIGTTNKIPSRSVPRTASSA